MLFDNKKVMSIYVTFGDVLALMSIVLFWWLWYFGCFSVQKGSAKLLHSLTSSAPKLRTNWATWYQFCFYELQ